MNKEQYNTELRLLEIRLKFEQPGTRAYWICRENINELKASFPQFQ